MIYDIESKSDIVSGTKLTVTICEEDLDRKALYTLLEDRPGFVLPFWHRAVDGNIEFVYQTGQLIKLQYLSGQRETHEYTTFWLNLLSPLFDCGDWFLKPYSFAMDTKYLYCDKNNSTVSYVYIPSMKNCSDYCDLREMAAVFSRQITVTDANLENRVLRAIMMDFNPKTFIQILRPAAAVLPPPPVPQPAAFGPAPLPACNSRPLPAQGTAQIYEDILKLPEERQVSAPANTRSDPSDIVIMLPEKDKASARDKREKAEKKKLQRNGDNKRKKSKRTDGGLWKSQTAAACAAGLPADCSQPVPEKLAQEQEYRIFPEFPPVNQSSVTQTVPAQKGGACLRLVGAAALPKVIEIQIEKEEVFTIGRFDTASGRKKSNFEFPKDTRAVSRRHAAVILEPDGYAMLDLSSSAGTYINGRKLPPNTPSGLQTGCRISFGNCGADYVWEQ